MARDPDCVNPGHLDLHPLSSSTSTSSTAYKDWSYDRIPGPVGSDVAHFAGSAAVCCVEVAHAHRQIRIPRSLDWVLRRVYIDGLRTGNEIA